MIIEKIEQLAWLGLLSDVVVEYTGLPLWLLALMVVYTLLELFFRLKITKVKSSPIRKVFEFILKIFDKIIDDKTKEYINKNKNK